MLSCHAASAAAAERGGTLELPAVVRGGSTIVVHWDASGLRADEVEIVLSLDSGRQFTLHVSPELDPSTDRYVWRVPNLAAAGAVMALRLGRGAGERVWQVSRPFRIVADPTQAPGRFALHEGTPWCASGDPLPAASAWSAPRAEFRDSSAEWAGVAPRGSAVTVPMSRAAAFSARTTSEPRLASRPSSAPRQDFPLRN
jgi:hypothetical protein